MAPYETMLKSTSYERMRAAHQAEFAPASVFFTHDARNAIDRRNSFRVKAALVYWAITGRHVDDHMPRADSLLLALANACHSAIYSSSQQKDPANGPTKADETGKHKKVEGDGEQGSGSPNKAGTQQKEEKAGEPGSGSPKARAEQKEDKAGEPGSGSPKARAEQKEEKAGEPGSGSPKARAEQKEEKAGEPGSDNPKARAEQKEEKAELVDAAWDEEHKRVVDGIFLVVGFLPRLKHAIDTSTDRDGVDESFKSQHMHDIVTDVIKLENQLPLKDLLDVVSFVEGVINRTVGSDEFKDVKASIGGDGKYKLGFTRESFGDVVHDFCWYYSPFLSKKAPPPANGPFKGVANDEKMAARTLLDCLHQSVVPEPGKGAIATGGPSRMPAAKQLRRSGIRLQPAENGRAEIEFKVQWAMLTLPALVYDYKLATVARNLLAREYEEQSKPMTRYFQMMNELVEGVVDVKILRRAGVVRGASEGALELIKNIDGHATFPSVYMAMDREIQMVKQHHDKRMTNFFVRNRPGVIWASSVAAISVVAIVAARKIRG